LSAGADFGAYRIERPLGRGGLGSVHLARDTAGGAIALKLIDLGGPDGTALHAHFEREVAVVRRLHHPAIVHVHETGQVGEVGFIAMEFVDGGDLAQARPGSERMPLRRAAGIAMDIAQALAHAHAQGVLHRDIKPANILLDRQTGQARLADFGLARLADLQRSRTGVLAGTPAYMSPEQLAEANQDARSDLYSLGVVLFELLTGRLPHEADSLGALLRSVSQGTAPPLERWRPEAPPALASLVARMLHKDRRQRPADALALTRELQALLETMPP